MWLVLESYRREFHTYGNPPPTGINITRQTSEFKNEMGVINEGWGVTVDAMMTWMAM